MHPAVKILVYFIVLLTLHSVADAVFWYLFLLAIASAVLLQKKIFLTRCTRLKWLFLSIFLVYALGTPGEYIVNSRFALLPTFEGIYLGLLQVARLLLAISLLSILFFQTNVFSLVQGLHSLLKPLQMLNLDPSGWIIRLLLTLNYVDVFTAKPLNKKTFFSLLQEANTPTPAENLQTVVLKPIPFVLVDWLAILLATLYVLFVLNGELLR